ncbi:MAG: DUF547 domain-containing protein [Myxococcales bacterium]|nr:DUF547 domain-containing protein [Myxococcales bacterium]
MSARICLLFVVGLAGCGDYVAYGDGSGPAAPDSQGADVLDEDAARMLADADRLDHLRFEALMARIVHRSDDGLFTLIDYDGLAGTMSARDELATYLGELDLVTPDQLADRDERLAYWINAYNANVIFGIIESYGGDHGYSVQDRGFLFFKTPAYRVAGETLSLDQIEHGIIRGAEDHEAFQGASAELQSKMRRWHEQLFADGPVDARIHMALNCASLGCPNLPGLAPYAYHAALLDAQLDAAARNFVNNPRKGAGPDGVSTLLTVFYPGDFEAEYGGWRGFVEMFHANPSTVNFSAFIQYDWTLNITTE